LFTAVDACEAGRDKPKNTGQATGRNSGENAVALARGRAAEVNGSMAVLLPAQFPCLVKAVYSFAGESKGDLGFVQGDLIECLNPGDGQWWFGRLKRNKTIGVFPSNYVELV